MWEFAKRFANANEMQSLLVQKIAYFLCNALNVSIMWYLSNLHEKRLFCVRFALFFAQNTRFVHLFARFLHSYEKLVFPTFLAFLPLNPPLLCSNSAFSTFYPPL